MEVEPSYSLFFIVLATGMLFIFISFIFLPFIALSPQKFVSFFSIGSLISLSSFIFIYGTLDFIKRLFDSIRIHYTLMYLVSILMGLYFSYWQCSYLLSLLSAGVQAVMLVIFILTFIPGGQGGISIIKSILYTPVQALIMKVKGGSHLPF